MFWPPLRAVIFSGFFLMSLNEITVEFVSIKSILWTFKLRKIGAPLDSCIIYFETERDNLSTFLALESLILKTDGCS